MVPPNPLVDSACPRVSPLAAGFSIRYYRLRGPPCTKRWHHYRRKSCAPAGPADTSKESSCTNHKSEARARRDQWLSQLCICLSRRALELGIKAGLAHARWHERRSCAPWRRHHVPGSGASTLTSKHLRTGAVSAMQSRVQYPKAQQRAVRLCIAGIYRNRSIFLDSLYPSAVRR